MQVIEVGNIDGHVLLEYQNGETGNAQADFLQELVSPLNVLSDLLFLIDAYKEIPERVESLISRGRAEIERAATILRERAPCGNTPQAL